MGGMPIKSSDVPVGGRGYGSLPFVFDLVNLLNGIGTTKDAPPDDPDGAMTLVYLGAVEKRLQRITTTSPGSLGLHPLAYFYTRGSTFQPVAFLAVMQVIGRLVERKRLDRFTDVRRAFELFVMNHKEAFTFVVKRQGSGPRSRPALEAFLEMALDGLWAGKNDKEIIADMSADPRFSFFATPAPVREASEGASRDFDSKAKTAALCSDFRRAVCGAQYATHCYAATR